MSNWKDLSKLKEQPHLALTFLTGAEAGKQIPLVDEGDIMLGRGSGATVVIPDKKASRLHAKLVYSEGSRFIEDLASSNGTRLNGQKIDRAPLEKGDLIQIGDFRMRVEELETITQSAWIWWSHRPNNATINPDKINDDATMTTVLSGSLSKSPLVDLLLMLNRTQRTGVMNLKHGPSRGMIYFKEGQIYHCLKDADVHVPAEKNLFRLLRWEEGDFEFVVSSPIDVTKPLEVCTTALIIEGAHHADQFSQIAHRLPHPERTLRQRSGGSQNTESGAQGEIFAIVKEPKTFKAVLDLYEGPDLFAAQAISNMIEDGLLETS